WEGTMCTGLSPDTGCTGAGFTPPVLDYGHDSGRCSITGGYVYRGSRSALPTGSYVFGDYCSGEIFLLANNAVSTLLDTSYNISSFGEDEAGEIYVVNLNGTVDRIVSSSSCTYSIDPTNASVGVAASTGSVSVTASAGCSWTAVSNDPWIV